MWNKVRKNESLKDLKVLSQVKSFDLRSGSPSGSLGPKATPSTSDVQWQFSNGWQLLLWLGRKLKVRMGVQMQVPKCMFKWDCFCMQLYSIEKFIIFRFVSVIIFYTFCMLALPVTNAFWHCRLSLLETGDCCESYDAVPMLWPYQFPECGRHRCPSCWLSSQNLWLIQNYSIK